MRRHAEPRRGGRLRSRTGGGPRRLPAVVPPPRPFHRHGDALRGQHAAGRHHAPLFRLFRHRGFARNTAARRSVRHRIAGRSRRVRLHARLRRVPTAPDLPLPARSGGNRPLLRQNQGDRRQHRRRSASANASPTRCCAAFWPGPTPSTAACGSVRRSTTTP